MKHFLKTAGPGILFASTAIGVSHLVQSTRAGADYGYALLGVIALANLLKYPFFEFGSRYANTTGKSLIDGYASMGRWMLWVYIAITALTMFFVSAAVGAVTVGFMVNLFQLDTWLGEQAVLLTTITLFGFCLTVLARGAYRALDRLIKVISSVMVLGTLFVFVSVLFKADQPELSHTWWFEWEADPDPIFIIALIGWMPTAIDLSAWNSLWTIERIKTSGYRPSLRETLRDFNLGYLVSAVLAVMFGVIGAQLMYGSGLQYPNSTIGFADTLLNIYTSVMGRWSYFVIATSGFCIMLGTCIAVFDGYARSAERCIALLSSPSSDEVRSSSHYRTTVVVTTIGAFTVIYLVGAQLKTLIDVAMTLSFMVAPVIAAANFYLVAGKGSHPAGRPNIVLNALAILGLAFLTLIAVWYLISTLV